MKHGYFVKGRDGTREYTFGLCQTLAEVKRYYQFVMSSEHYSDQEKKTFRIVELVERTIEPD